MEAFLHFKKSFNSIYDDLRDLRNLRNLRNFRNVRNLCNLQYLRQPENNLVNRRRFAPIQHWFMPTHIIPQPGLPEGVLTFFNKESVLVARPSGSPRTWEPVPPVFGP